MATGSAEVEKEDWLGRPYSQSGVTGAAGIVLVYLCKDLIPTALSKSRRRNDQSEIR